jgi:hypothetical protein
MRISVFPICLAMGLVVVVMWPAVVRAQDAMAPTLMNEAREAQTGADMPVPPAAPTEMMPPAGIDGASIALPDLAGAGGVTADSKVLERVNEDMESERQRLDAIEGGVPSILFTDQEQAALARAIDVFNSGNWIKPPTDTPDAVDPEIPVIEFTGGRELRLSGISYGDGQNWVIWLNNQRMTPTRLPPEVKSIKVYKNYVEIRWLDGLTQTEIPVRLRPNQRFNLDSRSFLPG